MLDSVIMLLCAASAWSSCARRSSIREFISVKSCCCAAVVSLILPGLKPLIPFNSAIRASVVSVETGVAIDCVVVTDVGVEMDDVFIVCVRSVPARAVFVVAVGAATVEVPPICGARSDAAPNAAVVAMPSIVVIRNFFILSFLCLLLCKTWWKKFTPTLARIISYFLHITSFITKRNGCIRLRYCSVAIGCARSTDPCLAVATAKAELTLSMTICGLPNHCAVLVQTMLFLVA